MSRKTPGKWLNIFAAQYQNFNYFRFQQSLVLLIKSAIMTDGQFLRYDNKVACVFLSSPKWTFRAREGRGLIEKGWDCHHYIGTLVSNIDDYEDNVIETILCALENSR